MDEFMQGVIWFDGDRRGGLTIRQTPDEVEAMIEATNGRVVPFITVMRPNGEEIRINASQIRRIGRPEPDSAPASSMKSPWG